MFYNGNKCSHFISINLRKFKLSISKLRVSNTVIKQCGHKSASGILHIRLKLEFRLIVSSKFFFCLHKFVKNVNVYHLSQI